MIYDPNNPRPHYVPAEAHTEKLKPTELCATCGMSLRLPPDWTEPWYFTINDGKGVHHDYCWSRHPDAKLKQIEEMAKAAWAAGL